MGTLMMLLCGYSSAAAAIQPAQRADTAGEWGTSAEAKRDGQGAP